LSYAGFSEAIRKRGVGSPGKARGSLSEGTTIQLRMKQLIPGLLTALLATLASGAFAATNVQAQLEAQGLVLTLLGIFVGGIAISLTPCVYPMIPITLSIIGARSAESKPIVGFMRSLVFVLGIASIYTVLGLVVALSGGTVGFLLQSKGFLFSISVLFIVLGLSMLGLFNLQLPPSIAAKLQGSGNRGGFFGAFLLGITTGVVASPCGSPVLVSILALAGAKGQAALGAVMLFTYAMGIGLLFLVLGAFPAFLSKVPKSGVWMEDVKKFLGLVLIIAAFYYLSLALPVLLVWGMLIATSLIFAGLIAIKSHERAQWPRLLWAWRLAGLALVGVAVYAALALVPRVLERDAATLERLQKKAAIATTGTATLVNADGSTTAGAVATPPADWLTNEPEALALARVNGWPVMIDFGAEWCAACKELEHKTFPDPAVEQALASFVKVKIDCTEDTDETKALQAKYNSVSLPTIAFIDANGEFKQDLSLLEFEAPAQFIERLKKVTEK